MELVQTLEIENGRQAAKEAEEVLVIVFIVLKAIKTIVN
jgi:hypothetical protein